MRNLGIKFGLLCMMLVSLASCKKDEETIFEISSDYVTIDSVGGTEKVIITTNKSWNVTSLEDWVTLSQSVEKGNGELIIKASKMSGNSDRESYVTGAPCLRRRAWHRRLRGSATGHPDSRQLPVRSDF